MTRIRCLFWVWVSPSLRCGLGKRNLSAVPKAGLQVALSVRMLLEERS